ncbi:hypothetical protein [Burkholderia territorii]|uniref:hypothetical protein n=1 Tax=Burkholderia territorii TaxID=1503055 RepID=UPI000AD869E0|nr:hypothetical protein [Burkholderia territorii]
MPKNSPARAAQPAKSAEAAPNTQGSQWSQGNPPPGFLALTAIDRGFSLATDVVWALALVGVFYCIYLCIQALAGQTTVANFVLSYMTDPKGGASAKPWIGSTALATLWGIVERWLRRRKVASMSRRAKDLERLYDANRTSSGLTETGQVPRRNGDA